MRRRHLILIFAIASGGFSFFLLTPSHTSTKRSHAIQLSTSAGSATVGEKLRLFFFSCKTCRVRHNSPEMKPDRISEPANGLFLISSCEKTLPVGGIPYRGALLEFISFKSGTLTLPHLEFTVSETLSQDEKSVSSTSSIVFPETQLTFVSRLQNRDFAPLYGRITAPGWGKIAGFLIAIAILVTIFLLRRFLVSSHTVAREKGPSPDLESLRTQILALKEQHKNIRAAYSRLSDYFKTWLEVTFKISAHTMLTGDIVSSLSQKLERESPERSSCSKEIHLILKNLDPQKFSKGPPVKSDLQRDIEKIIGMLNEFQVS